MRVQAMMGEPPPDKRPRLSGPPTPGHWQNPSEPSRQLPLPPVASPYQQHPTPFSRPQPLDNPFDNRRPPELPPYDHQEARRPNSGPAPLPGYHGPPSQPPPLQPPPQHQQPPQHPHTYTGPPREPMVKRDPSDEPPQPYRPHSQPHPYPPNGHDHNVAPSPHHEGPVRYQQPPYDPARNQSYPHTFPPAQSPMSATEPYGPTFGTPGPTQNRPEFNSVSYPAPSREQQIRKKAQRAAQACDSCRTLKAKCDEGRPFCSTCKEKGIECRYRDPPPKQQDKSNVDVMDGLARLENIMTTRLENTARLEDMMTIMSSQVGNLIADMNAIKRTQSASNSGFEASRFKQEVEENVNIPTGRYDRPSVQLDTQPVPLNDSPSESTLSHLRAPEAPTQDAEQTDEEEEEDRTVVPGKPPSIPVNHTTGNARLLLVPAIKALCEDALKTNKICRSEKFPTLQEEKRGLLRLYGWGEGHEHTLGYEKTQYTEVPDGTPGDSHSDVSSPAGEEWGQIGGLTPPAGQPELTIGCIGPGGMPDFSRDTVYELVRSYEEHINNMHPILVPSRLRLLVEQFLKSIPESQARPRQVTSLVAGHTIHPSPGFVGSYKNPESPGNKRKRSPVSGEFADPQIMLDHKPGHPFRSIGSAIVLLVMALGKLCKHRGKTPGPYRGERGVETSHGGSPIIRNGQPPSPLQSSPSMSNGKSVHSPVEGERAQPGSRRASFDGNTNSRGYAARPRNIDVIPGLSYLALATDVIGNQIAGNSLQHVHANLLSALYYGQLARVMESHGHISAASRSLQVILAPKLAKFSRIKTDYLKLDAKDHPLVLAFWTTLQLESDILAEIPCPQSGILTYEIDMPAPSSEALYADGFNILTVQSYMAQLYLRKHLNMLHEMFYNPKDISDKAPTTSTLHFATIEAVLNNLSDLTDARRGTAPSMAWDPILGEPANDILNARLRAKYYGAEVITYRHIILKILDANRPEEEQIVAGLRPGIKALDFAPVPGKTRAEDVGAGVLDFARRGIQALVHSTRAFWGLGDQRIIVTNVWGTAHAQWGNVLTLLGAYKNEILHDIVLQVITQDDLRVLCERTLTFLKLTATPTSALLLDYKILIAAGYAAGVLGTPPPHGNASSSFSSSHA